MNEEFERSAAVHVKQDTAAAASSIAAASTPPAAEPTSTAPTTSVTTRAQTSSAPLGALNAPASDSKKLAPPDRNVALLAPGAEDALAVAKALSTEDESQYEIDSAKLKKIHQKEAIV